MVAEITVVQVLFTLSLIAAALATAGKVEIGKAKVKLQTLGLAVCLAAGAFLVQATNFFS